jgi:hypothetical protein
MAKLSAGQILTLARAAGFSGTRKVKGMPEDRMAVAIALGESGGNPQAHNPVPPDDSYGLWQINMLASLGPARREQFGISSNDELFNPAINAKAANMVFREAGNSFRPWSVYTSGSWMRHRSAAMAAQPEGNIPTPEQVEEGGGNWWDVFFEVNPWWDDNGPIDVRDPLQDAAGVLSGIGDAFSFMTDPENWKRVALFIAGGLALIIAIIAIMDKLGAGKAVSAIPAGRALRAVGKVK